MSPNISKGKILIIDDQLNWRMALATILKKAGFEVLLAKSIEEAQFIIKNNVFHVAVLDVRLERKDTDYKHNIDGIGLLREIKTLNPNIQAIIITGYPNDVKDKDEADVFLLKVPNGKSFDRQHFIAIVQELVEKSKLMSKM